MAEDNEALKRLDMILPHGTTAPTGKKPKPPVEAVEPKLVGRSVKLTPEENEWIAIVMEGLGTTTTSKAIRWLLAKGWEAAGDTAIKAAEKMRESKLED